MPRLALAALLMTLLPLPATAASLSVAPTRVDLVAGDATGVVTLQNNAAEPVMVQVQTFAWPHSPASADLEPTRDLLAVPPVFELAGNARQIIRVALRGARHGRARACLPAADHRGAARRHRRHRRPLCPAAQPARVRHPAGAEPKPVWSVRQTAGASELVLRNEGTAHLQVRRIVLRSAGRGAPAGTIDTPAYVLAGQEHAWPLPSVAGSTALQLEAETSIGPLSATVAPPRG